MTCHINKYIGEYHPILSDVYDLFSRYYLGFKSQEKKAVTYAKASIRNVEKLLGGAKARLADHYFALAEVYLNYQKNREALNSLNRAKDILR